MRRLKDVRLALLLAGLLTLILSEAEAAPIGGLKQFRVPTPNSSPLHITQGSDGNFWFTEGFVLPPHGDIHNVGRITPDGRITEFAVCNFCFPNDIVQGPDGILYFTKNDPALGRITTSGQVLSDVVNSNNSLANGNGLAAGSSDIWYAAFNTDSIWRYSISSGQFTEYPVPTPGATPYDVAVDAGGIVWFTESAANRIGRLDPNTGVISETVVPGDPRQIAIATDGTVWFTERFQHVVGRLDPSTNVVTMFPLTPGAGPEDIAAAPDGSLWFTQANAGNIARITAAGVITEARRVKDSEPAGITVAADGNPWYTELAANKIAVLLLR